MEWEDFEITENEYVEFAQFAAKPADVVISDKLKLDILQNLYELERPLTEDHQECMKRMIDQGTVVDVSDSCLITQYNAVDLIQSLQLDFYHAMLEFSVHCRLVNILEYFKWYSKTADVEAVGNDTVRGEKMSKLATDIIALFNKHTKGAKLKFVQAIRCNESFGYLSRYYLTISAMNEETGCVGTYQVAFALRKRSKTFTVGLVRDVDANKVLGVLSIEGAEVKIEADLKATASSVAESRARQLAKDELFGDVKLKAKRNCIAEEVQVYRSGDGEMASKKPSLEPSLVKPKANVQCVIKSKIL